MCPSRIVHSGIDRGIEILFEDAWFQEESPAMRAIPVLRLARSFVSMKDSKFGEATNLERFSSLAKAVVDRLAV